jgi:hypothetical protein
MEVETYPVSLNLLAQMHLSLITKYPLNLIRHISFMSLVNYNKLYFSLFCKILTLVFRLKVIFPVQVIKYIELNTDTLEYFWIFKHFPDFDFFEMIAYPYIADYIWQLFQVFKNIF